MTDYDDGRDDRGDRQVLLVPHAGRSANLEMAAEAAELLEGAGIGVRVLAGDDP